MSNKKIIYEMKKQSNNLLTKNGKKKFNKEQNKKIIGINDSNEKIIFNNVSYIYNKKTNYEYKALKNINLKIKPGIITAIIGSTGSGKSTLIQQINGLLIPETGSINIGEFEINSKMKKIKNVKTLRKSIGLVFQFPEYQLFEDTVEKDVMFGALNMGWNKEEASSIAKKCIKLVELDDSLLSRPPFNLSGGQKRRVAIAGILALDGNTLIFDEPTAGLDPQGEISFLKLFKKLNKEKNKRIIIISHDMDNILALADEIIVMDKSQIKFQGTPFEIFQNHSLISSLNIKIPKIYKLINKLNEKGFNFSASKIRTIKDFVNEVSLQIKGE